MSGGKGSKHRRRKDQARRRKEALRREERHQSGGAAMPKMVFASPTSLSGILGGSYAMERMLREARRVSESRAFSSVAEMNAFFASTHGQAWRDAVADLGPSTPEEEAQELAYLAMEAPDAETAASLAVEAIEIHGRCIDAHTVLARLTAESPDDAIEKLKKVVLLAGLVLGEDFFKENRGHFWGLIETRPYMRARQQLADLLWHAGRTEEAATHFEEMLDLNPGDNQGVRDVLLSCHLTTKNLDGARRLFRQFNEEATAFFLWGRVLERLLAGDERAAQSALIQARRSNPFVEAYLCGKRRLPRRPPDLYEIGEESEAKCCAFLLRPAWKCHREAMKWLKAQAEAAG